MKPNMPDDPVMLLSFVNTKLRDEHPSLADFCIFYGISAEELEQKLAGIQYRYDADANRFV